MTEFSVAVTHSSRDQQTGEWADESTDWFRVTVWGDRAERAAEQFRKGNRVFVEGRFRSREFERKDGTKGISLEITADNVIPFERRARDDEGGGEGRFGGQAGTPAVSPVRPGGGRPPADDDLDDLPF